MNQKEVIELLSKNNMSPNKKFGQNFIIHENLINKIINSIENKNNLQILEIGPGLGVLTKELLKIADKVHAVEIDAGMFRTLKDLFSETNLDLIHSDFLKLVPIPNCNCVVANLPYYCSSEILIKLAKEYKTVDDIYVMLQKEMCERIVATAESDSYGSFSVFMNYFFTTKFLFDIKPENFYPRPAVTSSFIHLKRKQEIIFNDNDFDNFEKLLRCAFWSRRKTFMNALKKSPFINLEIKDIEKLFIHFGFDPNIRGETFPLDVFIEIAKYLSDVSKTK